MLRLVIEDDEGKTTIVPLIRDEITIGRKEGNTIRLTERNVSRHHARLVRTAASPPTILIEDLKSYNGVRLNGDRIADKATLKIGDLIQIGDYALALRDDAAEEQRSSAPAPDASGIDSAPTAVHQVEELPESKWGKLVVISSNIAGETYQLNRRELIVGRTDENDIVVNHRSISRNHAKIIFRDDSFTIIDLASSNGVKVNREPYGTASLVKGDIVELGQVKMRYVAPGDAYVFTPTDIDDSDMLPGPGIGRLVLIGMVLAAVAVGVFFLVDRSGTADGGDQPDTTAVAEPTEADIKAWMTEAQSHFDKKDWDKAAKMYGRVLQADPDHPEATSQRSRAQKESSAKRTFDRIANNVKGRQWLDAYREYADFPIESIYYKELAPYTSVIEAGYADAELERGVMLIEQSNRKAAERIYDDLRKKDFAQAQAKKLRAALDRPKTVSPATAPVAPTTAIAVRPKSVAPRRPASRAPSTRKRRVTAPASEEPKISFDELISEVKVLVVQGRSKKAYELLLKARKMRPNAKSPHQQLCVVLPKLGRQRDALRHCRTWAAKERNPGFKERARAHIRRLEEERGE